MIWMISLLVAAATAFTVEWAQRHCEAWAQKRDEAL
jgi:hypothetical protein